METTKQHTLRSAAASVGVFVIILAGLLGISAAPAAAHTFPTNEICTSFYLKKRSIGPHVFFFGQYAFHSNVYSSGRLEGYRVTYGFQNVPVPSSIHYHTKFCALR